MEIVKKETLAAIDKRIGQIRATNRANSAFINSTINQKINYNVLTALARLLSINEVCGCVYYQQETNSVFISTNKDQKTMRELIDKKLKLKREVKCSRKSVGLKIYNLVSARFKEKEKLDFYKEVFFEIAAAKKINCTVVTSYIISGNTHEKEVAILSNRIIKIKWNDLAHLKEVNLLFNELRNKLKVHPIALPLKREAVMILIYLSDISEIITQLNENYFRGVSNFIISNKETWTNRYSSADSLHAEMAAVESENRFHEMKTVSKEFSIAAYQGRLAISKILCLGCKTFFDSLAQTYNSNYREGKSIDFQIFGASMVFFPGWKAPFVRKEKFNQDLSKILDSKLQKVKDQLTVIEKEIKPNIETSDHSKIVNNYIVNEVSLINIFEQTQCLFLDSN